MYKIFIGYLRIFLKIFLTIFLGSSFLLGCLSAFSGFYALYEYYSMEGHPFTIVSFGAFGEYLEPAGKLFTIALIATTIFALMIQQDANKLHKEEFDINRLDNKKDKFENHFFQLLKIYESIISSLKYTNSDDGIPYFKREVFLIIYNKFTVSIDKIHKGNINSSVDLDKTFKSIYSEFYSGNQEHIGHYYRTIYQIMKLIDTHSDILTIDERKFYSGILRAQLSTYELLMMFYNCLSIQGENLKKYALQYDLFKHMDKQLLFNIRKDDFLNLYGKET